MAELYTTTLLSDGNLQAYYRFNTSALTTDSSSKGITLTNNNTVGETSSGKFGYGADFGSSNTNKSFTATSTLGIDGGAISISLWVKLSSELSAGVQRYTFAWQGNDTSKVAYSILYFYNSGTPQLLFYRSRPGVTTAQADYTVTLGTSDWRHIVLTYDTTNLKGYVDGQLVAGPTAASGNGSSTASPGLGIGASKAGADFCSTLMDDVAIFDRALTADEVLSLYKSGNSGFFNFF